MAIAKKMKLDHAQLKEFELTLSGYKQGEWFVFVSRQYDIVAAKFLIHKLELEPVQINVKEAASNAYLAYGDNAVPLFAHIDDDFLSNHLVLEDKMIDLSDPLIYAVSTFGRGKDKQTGRLLIDGHHRLRKAFLLGVETLPAYVLSELITKQVEHRN